MWIRWTHASHPCLPASLAYLLPASFACLLACIACLPALFASLPASLACITPLAACVAYLHRVPALLK
jgi:hypothetical protein